MKLLQAYKKKGHTIIRCLSNNIFALKQELDPNSTFIDTILTTLMQTYLSPALGVKEETTDMSLYNPILTNDCLYKVQRTVGEDRISLTSNKQFSNRGHFGHTGGRIVIIEKIFEYNGFLVTLDTKDDFGDWGGTLKKKRIYLLTQEGVDLPDQESDQPKNEKKWCLIPIYYHSEEEDASNSIQINSPNKKEPAITYEPSSGEWQRSGQPVQLGEPILFEIRDLVPSDDGKQRSEENLPTNKQIVADIHFAFQFLYNTYRLVSDKNTWHVNGDKVETLYDHRQVTPTEEFLKIIGESYGGGGWVPPSIAGALDIDSHTLQPITEPRLQRRPRQQRGIEHHRL